MQSHLDTSMSYDSYLYPHQSGRFATGVAYEDYRGRSNHCRYSNSTLTPSIGVDVINQRDKSYSFNPYNVMSLGKSEKYHADLEARRNHSINVDNYFNMELQPQCLSRLSTLSTLTLPTAKYFRNTTKVLDRQRTDIKSGTIFFGSCFSRSSLVGSCSWWVSDECGKIISSGAVPFHQTYLNPSHLDFKALFHALNAAHVCGINQLVIKGTSMLVLSYISKDKPSQKIPYLDTVYESMSDLQAPIKRAFKRLYDYRPELIPIESNGFCDRLASKRIQKCQRRLLAERSDQSKIHLMNVSLTNNDDNDDVHICDY